LGKAASVADVHFWWLSLSRKYCNCLSLMSIMTHSG